MVDNFAVIQSSVHRFTHLLPSSHVQSRLCKKLATRMEHPRLCMPDDVSISGVQCMLKTPVENAALGPLMPPVEQLLPGFG